MPKDSSRESHSTARRAALWEVYGGRCAYTGELISGPEHVVIDHILPQRLIKDAAERQRVLADHNLPANFPIKDNPRNLVPTTSAFNSAKSDKTGRDQFIERFGAYALHHPYSDRQKAWTRSAYEVISHGLALAEAHHEAVERELRKLECKEAGAKVFEKLPADLRAQAVAESYDVMSGETPEFPVRTDLEERSVYAARSAVKLHCFLPTAEDPQGPALLSCMSLKIRGASITFDQRDLLGGLLRGFGSGTTYGERPFIVAPHQEGACVQLHHVRCWLPQGHVEQLCEIIDLVAPHYLDAHERLERDHWRSSRFPFAQRGFRLYEVSGQLWRLLLEYAHAHDAWNGNGPENIFDAKSTSFYILEPHGDHTSGGQVARIHVEQLGPEFSNPRSDRVAVCWDPLSLARVPGTDSSGPTPWHAEEVHAKVVQLLRRAWLWNSHKRSSRLSRLVNTLRHRPIAPLPSQHYTSTQSSEWWPPTLGLAFKTSDSMRTLLLAMQGYLSGPASDGQVPAQAVLGAYRFIRNFVRRHRPGGETLERVARALPTDLTSPDYETAMRRVEEFAHLRHFVFPGVAARALAGVFELLGGWYEFALPDDAMEMAAVELDPFYEHVRPRAYLKRLLSRPW
jgi:hypothetical protein